MRASQILSSNGPSAVILIRVMVGWVFLSEGRLGIRPFRGYCHYFSNLKFVLAQPVCANAFA